MSYLLDTNVLSEGMKPTPDRSVTAWLGAAQEPDLFVSVITLGEIRFGIQLMADGRGRRALDQWLRKDLPQRFAGRIFAVDASIADRAGTLAAERRIQGKPLEIADALVAATALVHDLTVVTRNTKDFVGSVRSVFNPWTGKTS